MQINAGENEKDKQTGIKKASPKRRFRDVFSIYLEIQREAEAVLRQAEIHRQRRVFRCTLAIVDMMRFALAIGSYHKNGSHTADKHSTAANQHAQTGNHLPVPIQALVGISGLRVSNVVRSRASPDH